MTIDEIKELIRVVHETGIAELEVQRGDNRVRIRSGVQPYNQEFTLPPSPGSIGGATTARITGGAVGSVSPFSSALPGGESSAFDEQAQTDADFIVKSPIVGTFYDTPSPGNPPFVKVGDRVEAGKVLCIIESMKLMNEIEAEVAGTVAAKLVDNGKPVEYGESLFSIHPDVPLK
jgi:acetyl-CoA carboxylase biotin carboxyl carrier protein